MDDASQDLRDDDNDARPLSLGVAILIYIASLIIFVVTLKLTFSFGLTAWIPVGMYLAIGIALNHLVFKRLVDWHPMYNTLANVTSGKLSQMLFWPLTYLVLFFQLAVNKIL